jgi:hypothetical protein
MGGWTKGKARGPSPFKGKKLGPRVPRLALKALNETLAQNVAPEFRFEQAFRSMMASMATGSGESAACAKRLLQFWNDEMPDTLFMTPTWKAKGNGDSHEADGQENSPR